MITEAAGIVTDAPVPTKKEDNSTSVPWNENLSHTGIPTLTLKSTPVKCSFY